MLMKYIRYIAIVILVVVTFFSSWMYFQRANLNYNEKGIYFSAIEGVTYYEQAKEIYKVLTLIGVIIIGVAIYRFKKK